MSRDMPRKLDAATIWRLLLAGYWLALCVAPTCRPPFPGLPGEQTDKLVHFGAYAGLAWLLAMAWQSSTGGSTGGICDSPGWRSCCSRLPTN